MADSHDPDRLPTLSLPSRGAGDNPAPLDHFLLARSLHVLGMIGTIAGGMALGFPVTWLILAGAAWFIGPPVWSSVLFGRLFREGQYRRALNLADGMVEQTSARGARSVWQLNQATCHIVLGDLESGKRLAAAIEPKGLSPLAAWVLRCNLAALHLKAGDPKRALKILDEGDCAQTPRNVAPYFHLNRAAAFALIEQYVPALADLEQVLKEKPRQAVMASALSLKAHIRREKDDDPTEALTLSLEAVKRLGKETRVQPQVGVTHARLLLEATGDEGGCLDALATVVDYELEMGLFTRAELHYLLACCYHRCGVPEDARKYLLMLTDLPCPAFLRERLCKLIDEVQASRVAPRIEGSDEPAGQLPPAGAIGGEAKE